MREIDSVVTRGGSCVVGAVTATRLSAPRPIGPPCSGALDGRVARCG